ncbi:MAG TPA: alpha/beta hydrolase [Acidimicrobiia bacterium]|nr:alpha/beta hydrolase [Acidimicrobiia bacterium]
MSISSRAGPRSHPVVGSQLVRRWLPEVEPTADIVLVHGIAEHCGRYERTGGLLAEAGYRVRSADLIGCGGTGGRRGDVEDWADFLDQVETLVAAARAEGNGVVLLGHSMGGLIALEYALSERPPSDLLVLSAPGLEGGAAWQRRLAAILARVAPRISVPNLLKGDRLSRDPEVAERYFSDPLVHTSTTARMGHQLFAAMERTRAAMGRLDVPTLVLHGGADTIVPPTATVELGSLPSVERRLYPGLRHEIFNEPEGPEIVAEVANWISERLP